MSTRIPAEVDVAIVGSGPTGAAYARILSELRPDLTLSTFEVGPLLADPPGLHVKNIADPAQRAQAQRRSEGLEGRLDDSRVVRPGTFLLSSGYQEPGEDGLPVAAMSSNVGGMGAHWTAACPRPGGRERPMFVPALDELLAEGERLLDVSADAFDDAPFADEVRRRLGRAFNAERPDDRQVQPMPLAVRRDTDGNVTWSGSDVVFGDATRANANYSLWPDALVTEVLHGDDMVGGVWVRDLRDDTTHPVRARVVVVAADALRTPQLLWASGIRPPALGRYLNDQPQIVYAVRLRDADPAQATGGKQSGVSWVPYTDDMPFHGQVMQLDASPIKLTDDDEPLPGTIVGLGWFCAKDISADDHIDFAADAVDQYGMPAMRIRYRLSDLDKSTREAAAEAIRAAAASLGEPLDQDPIPLPPGASLHYQGTVRMGATDDATSVCDVHSQVWDLRGLYVAGNGVIPTPIACNPTLLAVALAVGGARHIADTLRKD